MIVSRDLYYKFLSGVNLENDNKRQIVRQNLPFLKSLQDNTMLHVNLWSQILRICQDKVKY